MSENDHEQTFQSLDRRISALEQRVQGLEAPVQNPRPPDYGPRPGGMGVQPPPPPNQTYRLPPPGPLNPPPKADSDFEINEDLIGKRILPITGALLLLAALGYWAPVAYRSLSQAGAFGLELLASLLFTIGGRYFARKSTFFGEVVSGIGAGALLVTIMAGYQYHHLYSGTVMVSLSLLTSIGIVVTGMRLNSRAFESIGAVGGLISAWMPMSQHDIYVSALLQFSVVTATLIVFWQGRWKAGIFATWLFALVANYPFSFESNAAWTLKALAFLILSYEAALAYALCSTDDRENSIDDLPTVILSLAGIVSFGITSTLSEYAVEILIYSAVLFATSLAFAKESRKRKEFLYPGMVGLLLIAPNVYDGVHNQMVTIALTVIYTVWSLLRKDARIMGIALAQTTVALVVYIFHFQSAPFGAGLATWLLLMAVTFALAIGIHRRSGQGAIAFTFAALVETCLAFLPPSAFLRGLWHGELLVSALICGWALIFLFTGMKLSALPARAWGYTLLAAALAKALLIDLSGLDSAFKSAILTCLGIAMLIGGYLAIRNRHSEAKPV